MPCLGCSDLRALTCTPQRSTAQHTSSSSSASRAHATPLAHCHLMEVASAPHLGDSFSYGWRIQCAAAGPSCERLVDGADGGYPFGSSRSFIDMDPAELFSMRWTTTAAAATPASDFDFGLPGAGAGSPSRLLVSASQIFHNGRLLPGEPDALSRFQEHDDSAPRVVDVPSAAPRLSSSSPLFHSAQSTPASLSSCSSSRRRGGSSSPWKILLKYVQFFMPMYGKVRALRLRAPRPRVSPSSPARSSSSSVEWCHGIDDTAVRDAILYCKKSSGQADM